VKRVKILTAGGGQAWEAALVEACERGAVALEVVRRCFDLSDVLAGAAEGAAQAAVVASGLRWLDRENLARMRAENLEVVGVCPKGDEGTERRLRQIGITKIVSSDVSPEALAAIAGSPSALTEDPTGETELVPVGDDVAPQVGCLIAVWGPKGAPGRTTVAVNLAFELAARNPSTALVDADVYGGSVAQLLGIAEDTAGVVWASRLAARGEIDVPRLLAAARPAGAQGPRLISGLARAELWTELRSASWSSLLDLFRVAFAFTVVDLGFCLEEEEESAFDRLALRRNGVTRSTLLAADHVVAVARADPVGLRDFIQAFEELRDMGVTTEKAWVVANQVRPGLFAGEPASGVRAALESYLGVDLQGALLYDRQALDVCLREGRSLRECCPGSGLQQGIANLAMGLLGQPRLRVRPGWKPRGLLRRLVPR